MFKNKKVLLFIIKLISLLIFSGLGYWSYIKINNPVIFIGVWLLILATNFEKIATKFFKEVK